MPADVEAAAQGCKRRQGDGWLKAETAPAVLAVNTGTVSKRTFGGFSFLEVVQRRLQQCGLPDAAGAGVDDKADRAGYVELYSQFADSFDRFVILLQFLTDQRFGEGLDVVLQVTQGLVQHTLCTPALVDQLLQVLAVDGPCAAVPIGRHGRAGFEGFEPCRRGISYGARYRVDHTAIMHAVVFDARGFNPLL
ncbi:hypothetical protein D3C84_784580 [compost metagenome]